ncbi:MAG: NUDIX hydrolase [Gammaproteobacteria bacterium]|nr:NUDIX hydrolase [Gammaproteobacteria bacterium]
MSKEYHYSYPHPAITTDIVVFTISDGGLKLLLIKRGQEPYQGSWALPGGFLEPNEGLSECAQRELREETGLKDIYLEQLCTFGEPERDPRERVVSIAYLALMPTPEQPEAASDAVAAIWYSLDDLPALAFDHADIIALARKRLLSKLNYSSIALQFLPDTFTLSELQKVYEIVGSEQLDKRNFRKQITSMGVIEETDNLRRNASHRPARLYRAVCRDHVQFIK